MEQSAEQRPLVWVVDDSRIDAERAEAALSSIYEVRVFTDGAAMLESFAAERPPAAILLDVLMPGMSGIEVCSFLRSSGRAGADVAILMITAHRLPAQITQALEAGANDYLAKPYVPEELRARLAATLRTQEALARARDAEERLQRVLSSTPDAIIALGTDGRVAYLNRQAEEVLRVAAADARGLRLADIIPALAPSAAAGPGHEQLPDVEVQGRCYSPTVRAGPRGTGRTIALRDVTDERRVARRQLDFYSIIAHDLRSPLQAMLLRTDFIKRGQRGVVPAEVVSDIRKIENTLRTQLAMINDFLELARLESSAVALEQEPICARALVAESLEEMHPLFNASGIQYHLHAPPDRLLVNGDRGRLEQVLANLLSNAIKFTPRGKSVHCRVASEVDHVRFEVCDEGPGIDPVRVPTLFERYVRAIDERHEVAGTGLGLMIVREIVEAHGGSVGVQTEPEAGSTFWFRLPRLDAPAVDQPARPAL